jgi:hypothetical protein
MTYSLYCLTKGAVFKPPIGKFNHLTVKYLNTVTKLTVMEYLFC